MTGTAVTTWVALALFGAASVYSYLQLNRLVRAMETAGVRTRRLLSARLLRSVGLWQWSIALFLTIEGDPVNSVALWAMGGFMFLLAWGQRRLLGGII